MKSFKGVFKYGALLLVISVMFVMGVLVGRGTSPVSFDTRKFQKRLADIADKYDEQNPEPEKVELEFYDALDDPVPVKTTVPVQIPLSELDLSALIEQLRRANAAIHIDAGTVTEEGQQAAASAAGR